MSLYLNRRPDTVYLWNRISQIQSCDSPPVGVETSRVTARCRRGSGRTRRPRSAQVGLKVIGRFLGSGYLLRYDLFFYNIRRDRTGTLNLKVDCSRPSFNILSRWPHQSRRSASPWRHRGVIVESPWQHRSYAGCLSQRGRITDCVLM